MHCFSNIYKVYVIKECTLQELLLEPQTAFASIIVLLFIDTLYSLFASVTLTVRLSGNMLLLATAKYRSLAATVPLLLLLFPCYCYCSLAATAPLLLLPACCYCSLATATAPLLLLFLCCYCSPAATVTLLLLLPCNY